jgi:hypothetical protein
MIMPVGSVGPVRRLAAIVAAGVVRTEGLSCQIGGRDDQDLIIPSACPIIYIAGGTLDPVPVMPKGFNHFVQICCIAKLRQRRQVNLANDFDRPVPHQEHDFMLADQVAIPCSR